jgi:hypothetical protein
LQAIKGARDIGAEVLICAPWLPMAEKAETSLGLQRPVADALQELAEDEGVLFADLGDVSRLFSLANEDSADEAQAFERFVAGYRGFFRQTSGGEWRPKAALHQRLGHLLLEQLLDGASSSPWRLEDIKASWQKDGAELELRARLINPGRDRLTLTTLPLIASGWKPLEARPQVSLPGGASQPLTFRYARVAGDAIALQESEVRLPVLMLYGGQGRVDTLRATVQPLSVVWEGETLFNQEKRFMVGARILNGSATSQRGEWQAEFMGAERKGTFDLQQGAAQPLDLAFDLPLDLVGGKVAPLHFTVQADGLVMKSTRQITLTRNVGLNQLVALSATANAAGSVSMRAMADARSLSLTCQIQGAEMLLDAASAEAPAWQLEVHLDARSYGKRLEPGATAPIRVTGSAAPGAGQVHPLTAWTFGSGYAAGFDPREFKAKLNRLGSGIHEITLTVPRSYCYLHEWALGNGNSQLGFSLQLTLNTAEGYRTWTWHPTTKPADAVESLAVLELTEKPTPRVTVDVH